MAKVKPLEPHAMSQRLTVRMQFDDWVMLRELQLVLRLPTAGHAVRALIRLHHAAERDALRKLRRDPTARARLAETIDADFEGDTK